MKEAPKMKLFADEALHISKIHTVALYESNATAYPSTFIYNPKLPCYELIYFLSGEGITQFGDQTFQEVPGSIRYLPKNSNADKYTVTKTIPGICIDIYFDTTDPMPLFASSFKNMEPMRSLFEKIYNIWSEKKPGYYTRAMSLVYDIIYRFKMHSEDYLAKSQRIKLSKAYDYMLENYKNTSFDYKIMCEQSGLSYSYFKELFIRQYGASPVKYVTHLKIALAKELLITQQYSITEIASICGFENIYYFSTVFKKETGISPKNYR